MCRLARTAALVAGVALIASPLPLTAGGIGGPSVSDDGTRSIYETASQLVAEGRLSAARAAYEAKLELLQAGGGSTFDADRRSTIAALHEKIAALLDDEGRDREALAHYIELLAIRTELAAADPGDRVRRVRLAWAHIHVGNALQAVGNRQNARRHLAEAVAIQAPWATADAPPILRRDYAVAVGELAMLDGAHGEHDEAARRFSEATAILESLALLDPLSESLQEDLGRLRFQQGVEWSASGDSDAAVRAFRESRDIRLARLHSAPDDLERRARFAIVTGRLAKERADRDEQKAAAIAYREAIEHMQLVVAGRLDDLWHRQLLMRYVYRLADCLYDEGDTTERGVLYLRAIGLADRVLLADPTDTARRTERALIGQKYGWFEEGGKRYQSAWRAYDEARRIYVDLAAEAPNQIDRQTDLASIDDDLGDAWLAMKDTAEARRFYQEAYDIIERLTVAGPQEKVPSYLAHSLRKLARIDEAAGNTEAALERLKRARSLLESEAVARPDSAWVTKETKLVVDRIRKLTRRAKP